MEVNRIQEKLMKGTRQIKDWRQVGDSTLHRQIQVMALNISGNNGITTMISIRLIVTECDSHFQPWNKVEYNYDFIRITKSLLARIIISHRTENLSVPVLVI